MMKTAMSRRGFALTLAAGTGALALGALAGCQKGQALATSAPGASGGVPLSPVAGIDYRVLSKPVASDAPAGKVELIEFFGYWCPHCYTLAPAVETWRKQAPTEIVFNMVPVSFGDPAREPLQKLYYALRDTGKLDAMHMKVFDAVQKQRIPLFTNEAVMEWVAKQPELADTQFAQAYNAFGMNAQIQQANRLVEEYDIDGIPSFGVAGKYFCSGSMAKSLERELQIAEALALQEAKSGQQK